MIVFLIGIGLWICRLNNFLIVSGWIIFFCLSFGAISAVFKDFTDRLAKNLSNKIEVEEKKNNK